MISTPHVLLVGNFKPDRQESMIRFGQSLFDGLSARGISCEYSAPTPVISSYAKNTQTGFSKYLGYVDKYCFFSQKLSQKIKNLKRNSIVHILDHSNSPYLSVVQDTTHLVTCHDLIAIRSARGEFSEHTLGSLGKFQQGHILKHLQRAQYIACNSTQTQRDLLRITQRNPKKSGIINMGLNYPYEPLAIKEAEILIGPLFAKTNHAIPSHYILHVGSDAWYKNRAGVLEIFAQLRNQKNSQLECIFIGPTPDEALDRQMRALRIRHLVHFFEKINNLQLQALYSCAQCLLFPSIVEGFGLPIIEAMACGCPVITTGIEPMTELGESAARYIPLLKNRSQRLEWATYSAKLLNHVINLDHESLFALKKECITRSKNFKAQRMIEHYIYLYNRLGRS
jgi:glycosyltransferase involved in cell wall biosynthesis